MKKLHFTLRSFNTVGLFFFIFYSSFLIASPTVITEFIKVDQFGYRTSDQKIAIIANPQTGFNDTAHFTPGNSYQVKRWSDDAIVFSGGITAWNGGATHAQSGDKVWWFDFSSVTAADDYYIYDVTNAVGSYRFTINDCVYGNVMKAALRTYYYQRCGMAKSTPYAEAGWTDASCHQGTQQDADCRLYNNTNSSTSKNLSGGWHDAGDYNKYVNFIWETLTNLLLAYGQNPTAFGDNNNIPESGNGIPDLLDEVKYELDWLLKMQSTDGSVLSIVGGGSGSPPSADVQYRRYGLATSSATLTASSVFALAAIEYKATGIQSMKTYAKTLKAAAVNAWKWAKAHPHVYFYNTGIIGAGEQETDDYGRLSRKVSAACYLYAYTGGTTYKTFFDNNYSQIHLIQWSFAYPFEQPQQDALLYYTKLVGATTTVKNAITNAYTNSMTTFDQNLPGFTNQTDGYRAYMQDQNYVWGCNQWKCDQGLMFNNMNKYNLDATNFTNYTNAASGYLHGMHGVNPLTHVYMSNMSSYGAENSVKEFYNSWFRDGSALWDRVGTSTYGPAPGFVPGGPNPSYNWDGCCPSGCGSAGNNALCYSISISPPTNQPIQKSYKDFNNDWPIDSWQVTENAIYSQSTYVRLLSNFMGSGCPQKISSPAETSNAISFVCYPNPARSILNVLFNEPLVHDATIMFVNELKQEVYNEIIPGGTTQTEIDVNDFPSGIYMLIVVTGNEAWKQKVVVVK
ncbi:MAG TPA: glycoside hydrolase family 9 protein [Chitinophagales bacterium]|nr:glycoside hydrolase family 9 protein [Chitinophagales bacterium]